MREDAAFPGLIAVILILRMAGSGCDMGQQAALPPPEPPWEPTHHGFYRGKVGDQAGHPLANVTISAVSSNAPGSQSPTRIVDCLCQTDLAGSYWMQVEFVLPDPIPPTYTFGLGAMPPSGSGVNYGFRPIPPPGLIGWPLDTVKVDFVLTP